MPKFAKPRGAERKSPKAPGSEVIKRRSPNPVVAQQYAERHSAALGKIGESPDSMRKQIRQHNRNRQLHEVRRSRSIVLTHDNMNLATQSTYTSRLKESPLVSPSTLVISRKKGDRVKRGSRLLMSTFSSRSKSLDSSKNNVLETEFGETRSSTGHQTSSILVEESRTPTVKVPQQPSLMMLELTPGIRDGPGLLMLESTPKIRQQPRRDSLVIASRVPIPAQNSSIINPCDGKEDLKKVAHNGLQCDEVKVKRGETAGGVKTMVDKEVMVDMKPIIDEEIDAAKEDKNVDKRVTADIKLQQGKGLLPDKEPTEDREATSEESEQESEEELKRQEDPKKLQFAVRELGPAFTKSPRNYKAYACQPLEGFSAVVMRRHHGTETWHVPILHKPKGRTDRRRDNLNQSSTLAHEYTTTLADAWRSSSYITQVGSQFDQPLSERQYQAHTRCLSKFWGDEDHNSLGFEIVDKEMESTISDIIFKATDWESCHLLRAELHGVADSLAMTGSSPSSTHRVVIVLPSLAIPLLLTHAHEHDNGLAQVNMTMANISTQTYARMMVKGVSQSSSQSPFVELVTQRYCGDIDMERSKQLVQEKLDETCQSSNFVPSEPGGSKEPMLVSDGHTNNNFKFSLDVAAKERTKICIRDEQIYSRILQASAQIQNLTRYRFICQCQTGEQGPENFPPKSGPSAGGIRSHPLACHECNISAFARYRAVATKKFRIVATHEDKKGKLSHLTAVFTSTVPIVERFRLYTKSDIRYFIVSLSLRSLGDLHPVLLSHDVDIWWSLTLHYGGILKALKDTFEYKAACILWRGITDVSLSANMIMSDS